MTIGEDISALVGKTPLVYLKAREGARIAVKLEQRNPLGSVKDRIGRAMIDDAEKRGLLKAGGMIVEPTSGNTGLALAFVAATRGYHITLTMPDNMSAERKKLLVALGAELILTEGAKGMGGAIQAAMDIVKQTGAWMPDQFSNPANPAAHYATTGPEIWADTDGTVDIFVAGVGSGGTVSGVGRYLKEKNKAVKIVAVEPSDSPVLSGGKPGNNRIQGIGAGFVPKTFDRSVVDEIIQVRANDAGDTARELAREEGILCGISTGANIWAARELASRPENQGKLIATIACDSGERYLSTWLFD